MGHCRSFSVKNDKCFYLRVDGAETVEDHKRWRASLDNWIRFAKRDYVEVYDYLNWKLDDESLKKLYKLEQSEEEHHGRKAVVIVGKPGGLTDDCFSTKDRIFAPTLDTAMEIVESMGISIDDIKYDLNHFQSCKEKRYDCLYEIR